MEIVIGQQRSKRREQMGGRIESAMRSLIRREPVTKRFVIDAPGGNWLGITYTQNTHTHTMHFRAPCHRRQEGKSFDPENIYISCNTNRPAGFCLPATLKEKEQERERWISLMEEEGEKRGWWIETAWSGDGWANQTFLSPLSCSQMDVRSTCSVFSFFFFFHPLPLLFLFPPPSRMAPSGRRKKKCAGKGGGKMLVLFVGLIRAEMCLLWNDFETSRSSSFCYRCRRLGERAESNQWGGHEERKKREKRKEWRGVYYYDDYRVLPGNGESNHWQEACARRQSRELLSFSQLGWRWGEEQNKWNKIGKGSASTANPRRRLGSNISIMLWAGTALDWFQTRHSTTTSLLSFTPGWLIFATLPLLPLPADDDDEAVKCVDINFIHLYRQHPLEDDEEGEDESSRLSTVWFTVKSLRLKDIPSFRLVLLLLATFFRRP